MHQADLETLQHVSVVRIILHSSPTMYQPNISIHAWTGKKKKSQFCAFCITSSAFSRNSRQQVTESKLLPALPPASTSCTNTSAPSDSNSLSLPDHDSKLQQTSDPKLKPPHLYFFTACHWLSVPASVDSGTWKALSDILRCPLFGRISLSDWTSEEFEHCVTLTSGCDLHFDGTVACKFTWVFLGPATGKDFKAPLFSSRQPTNYNSNQQQVFLPTTIFSHNNPFSKQSSHTHPYSTSQLKTSLRIPILTN